MIILSRDFGKLLKMRDPQLKNWNPAKISMKTLNKSFST